jgi:type II secretory pathway component GspD/PulD (secretin)
VDESVRATQARLDVDDARFETAARVAGMVTDSFYVPLDAHRALVVRDTKENRQQYTRQEYETVYLPGLSKEELADIGNLAKNVFNAQQAVTEPSSGTITLRAPQSTLDAFNATMSQLLDGHSQVLLEVHMIQLAHISARNTGVQPPQSVAAMNVYSEEQSILNSNQALVQQIISSGLAAPGDTLAILGILLASGQVSSSLLTNGVALFGGGLTASALAPGSMSANFSLNSSDSRELDEMQLRVGDGEDATLKTGTSYPIQTSSYSSIASSVPTIPGLTGAGSSSSLSSLLASYGGVPNIPQVQYQDLGLTLKATPRVMRGSEVALKIDMKIDALAGTSINGNPVLSNRAWSGVVTVKPGEAVEVVSELDKTESRAISGVPGISEIPGLNNLTGKDIQKNYATLLIIITPHVIRGAQAAGHSPMLRVERGQPAR